MGESILKRGYDVYHSTLIGDIYMIVSEKGVEEIFLLADHFKDYHRMHPELKRDELLCKETKKQLKEYFEGTRLQFELPLAIEGTTFRKQVWTALQMIPYGETISYQQLAESIGNPKAVRAVGGANGANHIPLIIPCHRVIGKNGKMVGFMGTHTDVKEKLLAHEKKVLERLSE